MDYDKCPNCGKVFIDEWEMFVHEHECAVSCYTCKHRDTPGREEPCLNCWNRSKWTKWKDGEE